MLVEKSFTGEKDFQELRQKSEYAVELVDEVVYMSPAPTTNHQRIQGMLNFKFMTFLDGGKCEALQNINLRLYDRSGNKIGDVIPDLSIFCNLKDNNNVFIEDVPVITSEVVSDSSVYIDNIEKARLYKLVGVQEYWIINAKHKNVTIWDFKNDEKYIYCEAEICKSVVFSEFSIGLKELFHLG